MKHMTGGPTVTIVLLHLRTFSSHLTVIIGKVLLLSFFSFTFQPKILQTFISSQLTTWFRHDSQKTSMPPMTMTMELQVVAKLHCYRCLLSLILTLSEGCAMRL